MLDLPFDLYKRVSGFSLEAETKASALAWVIETDAVAAGWVSGRPLGSHSHISKTWGVGEEACRESMRILQSRGSISTIPGRAGGVFLASPSLERVPAMLEFHLRHSGSTIEDLKDAQRVLSSDAVQKDFPEGASFLSVLETVQSRYAAGGGDVTSMTCLRGAISFEAGRADVAATPAVELAIRMLTRDLVRGRQLSSTWDLEEHLNASRDLIRQALRILADLGIVETRRGRGGGYALQRPNVAGIERRLFPILAAHGHSVASLLPIVWAVRQGSLILAHERMQKWRPDQRSESLLEVTEAIDRSDELGGWFPAQELITRIADNPPLTALGKSLSGYQSRFDPSPVPPNPAIEESLKRQSRAILDHLVQGRLTEALNAQLEAFALVERLLANSYDRRPRRSHDATTRRLFS